MPKCFLVTFGWNTQVIIQLAIQQAVAKDDVFVLIIPSGEQDPKTVRSIKTLENYFYQNYPGVQLRTHSVEVRFFKDGILSVLDKINYFLDNGYEVYINISGGMRVLCLMTYTAAIIAKHYHYRGNNIHFTSLVIEGLPEDVKLFFPPIAPPKLTENEKSVLLLLYKEKSLSTNDISTKLNLSSATASRIIDKLSNLLLASKRREGKKTIATITDTGMLYVEIIERYSEITQE